MVNVTVTSFVDGPESGGGEAPEEPFPPLDAVELPQPSNPSRQRPRTKLAKRMMSASVSWAPI
jgi:hypothetical protein